MRLPTVADFTVTAVPQDDLDGFRAWTRYGGLSLDAAYATLCENPGSHQEDFMWMGDRAFAFYFAVLERFIHEVEAAQELDGETWILAHCIGSHLPRVPELHARIRQLCVFVLDGLGALPDRPERSRSLPEVRSAWTALQLAASDPP